MKTDLKMPIDYQFLFFSIVDFNHLLTLKSIIRKIETEGEKERKGCKKHRELSTIIIEASYYQLLASDF